MTIGQIYDVSKLEFLGWSDGQDHPAYSCWDYFDLNGKYLGPDKYGIEPIFV